LLPGDGIGPEVITEARRVLEALALPGLTVSKRRWWAARLTRLSRAIRLPQATLDIGEALPMPSCSARWAISIAMRI
jgi:3-isopropylmalate dehydrogenase